MDAIEQLRDATRPLHERLDGLPYAREVLAGTVAKPAYAAFLRAVHEVQSALERVLGAQQDPLIASFHAEVVARCAALDDDLTALDADRVTVDPPTHHARALAEFLTTTAAREPATLLGVIYVLEGSQLGGLTQHAVLGKRTDLAPALRYVAARGRDTRRLFQETLARISSALVDDAAIDRAIVGATRTFHAFDAIMRALGPDYQVGETSAD